MDCAIEQLHDEDRLNIDVKWYPWLLSPTQILRGRVVDKRTSYVKKLGSNARFQAMVKQFETIGREHDVQIQFDYSKGVIASSLDAHRLILWCQSTGQPKRTLALIEQLFSAYHEGGLNISDHSILLDCADKAGLDTFAAQHVLSGNDFRRQVGEQVLQSQRDHGVSGVPHFIITAAAGKVGRRSFAFPGAQNTDFLLNVVRKLVQGALSDCNNNINSKL